MKTLTITLGQIQEVIRAEGKTIIAAFDRDLKLIEGRLGNVEDRLGNVESKLDKHIKQNEAEFKQIMKRFDNNDDAHQELIGASDEICDRKIKQHCQEKHSFATN